MNFRKISAAFLALTMTAAALPNVSAEYILTESSVLTGGASVTTGEAAPASDFKYQANEDGVSVTITDYKGNGGDVVIPSEIEGKKVTSIGRSAFEGCTSLTSVEIPDSVTSIGRSAFEGCTSLTSVTIPDGVTSIGNGAFEGCTSLTSVEIPNSVTSIGDLAFWYCTSLTAINVDEKNVNYSSQDGVLFNKDKTVLIQYPEGKTADKYDIPNSVTSIGEYAFRGCTSLTSVTIPNSVTSIGDSAFEGCTSLTSVEIPDSVTSIGYDAFEDCRSLTSVEIPNSVTSIGGSAFQGCTSLTSVEIPDSVTSIGFLAFSNCTSLTAINVDEKNVNYSSQDGVLFNKDKTVLIQYPARKKDEKYEIPNSVTSIVDSAFSNCTSLTSVEIPDSVTSIGDSAFQYCRSLTSVEIPNSVTSIGDSAFEGCTSLTSVEIPDSVTSIGFLAFSNCTSLTAINVDEKNVNYSSQDGVLFNKDKTVLIQYPTGKTADKYDIPNSVTIIGHSAFERCTSLTSVTIPDSVTSIDNLAFRSCTSLTSVEIPDSVTSIGSDAFEGCTSLTAINVDEKNVNYSSQDGVLFNKDKTVLIQYPAGKKDEKYEIPSSVTSIVHSAFSNCIFLTSVTIPNSVTSIGWYAFSNCTSLTSVTIPDSVTSIGNYAFIDCTSLTAINVDEKNVNYSSENGVLFNKDKTELIQYPAGKTADKYDIPDSVTVIDRSAFEGCTSLTSVTIPDSVTSIGYSAFRYCTSLTSVIIPDSVTSIGYFAFADCTSLTIYGYENSYAQTYAVGNEIPFKILGKEAEINKGTGIIIENPNLTGKTLEVKTTSTTGTEITYDITLKDKDGNEVQPTGSVTVRVPLPNGWNAEKTTVTRKEADGTFTDMKAVYENGYMVFTTDHFSEYVLKQKPAVTLGDLNDDEKININDVKIALRGALNNNTLTEDQKIAADVNEDTKVNISDVKIILKAALNGGKL